MPLDQERLEGNDRRRLPRPGPRLSRKVAAEFLYPSGLYPDIQQVR